MITPDEIAETELDIEFIETLSEGGPYRAQERHQVREQERQVMRHFIRYWEKWLEIKAEKQKAA